MTERKRKPRVGKPRSEVFATRLDPKLKHLAEIAARRQRRSLANFIEWAIEKALEKVDLNDGITVAQASEKLWELDSGGRLVKLATNYPELLTHDEQRMWEDLQHEWLRLNWKEIQAGCLTELPTESYFMQRIYKELQAHASASNGPEESDKVVDQQGDTTP